MGPLWAYYVLVVLVPLHSISNPLNVPAATVFSNKPNDKTAYNGCSGVYSHTPFMIFNKLLS